MGTFHPGKAAVKDYKADEMFVIKGPRIISSSDVKQKAFNLQVRWGLPAETLVKVNISRSYEITYTLPDGCLPKCRRNTDYEVSEDEEFSNKEKNVAEEFEEQITMRSSNPKIQEAIDFINTVLAKGEKWTDPEFKPEMNSFCKPFE